MEGAPLVATAGTARRPATASTGRPATRSRAAASASPASWATTARRWLFSFAFWEVGKKRKGMQSCPRGRYGANCRLTCDCGNFSCDSVSGACHCPPGLSGPECSQSKQAAPLSLYHEMGSVVAGCRVGRFGMSCESPCECYNGALCNASSGQCSCATGWLGPTCQQEDFGEPPLAH